MTTQDPIADMFTRIRNAQRARKPSVNVPYSTFKVAIAQVLVKAGYVASADVEGERPQDKQLVIQLKYFEGKAVISRIDRVSKPGLKRSVPCQDIESVPGFGIAILSTSQGVMSGADAKRLGLGGEFVGIVS